MHLKKYTNKKIPLYNKKFKSIIPALKKNDVVQLYLYRILNKRVELLTITGKVIKMKKSNNPLGDVTITLQKKIYNVLVQSSYNLKSLSIIGLRVLKS